MEDFQVSQSWALSYPFGSRRTALALMQMCVCPDLWLCFSLFFWTLVVQWGGFKNPSFLIHIQRLLDFSGCWILAEHLTPCNKKTGTFIKPGVRCVILRQLMAFSSPRSQQCFTSVASNKGLCETDKWQLWIPFRKERCQKLIHLFQCDGNKLHENILRAKYTVFVLKAIMYMTFIFYMLALVEYGYPMKYRGLQTCH